VRTAFVTTLLELASEDPSVMLLTGDLGFSVFERFRDAHPDQFLNVGVAEQNMIGVAAGLALTGRRVFTYSIIPFATFRCLEQIRNDLCYHRLPVCVTGVGAGYSYGHMGSTHHALEDIAVMRSLPNMTVVCPGDPTETTAAVRAIAAHGGPCYLRLGKAGEAAIHDGPVRLTLGKALLLRDGKDLTLIGSGTMLATAAEVHAQLLKRGIQARLLSMPTIKPIDADAIERAAAETPLLVTIEEHAHGGLGSAVAETLSERNCRIPHLTCAAPDAFAGTVGSQQSLRRSAGLDATSILDRILRSLPARAS
jgi:transketolase